MQTQNQPRPTQNGNRSDTPRVAEPHSKGQLILPEPPPIIAARGVDGELWRTVKQVLYPAAKDDHVIGLVLDRCKKEELNPLTKPFHIVPVWDSRAHDGRGGYVDTIWPAITYYRLVAHRTGQYAGMETPKLGDTRSFALEGEVYVDRVKQQRRVEIEAPVWGEITVWRIVNATPRAFSTKLYWTETYATQGRSKLPTPMWEKRPFGQFLKCLEAAALRATFPEVGSQPTAEEMEERSIDDMSEPEPIRRGTSKMQAIKEAAGLGKAPMIEGTASEQAQTVEGDPPLPPPSGPSAPSGDQSAAPAQTPAPRTGNGGRRHAYRLVLKYAGHDTGYACDGATRFLQALVDTALEIATDEAKTLDERDKGVRDLWDWNRDPHLSRASEDAPKAYTAASAEVDRMLEQLHQARHVQGHRSLL